MNLGFGARSRGAAAAMLLAGSLMLGGSPALAQDADLSALTGSITSDGSSTVGPLTQAVAEEFIGSAQNVQVSVDISGTGGGFKRFCDGEIDVQNASRAIKEEEAAGCATNGVDWYEFEVAYDGITVVTNKENTWASCLTVDQLKQLWQKESPATTWAANAGITGREGSPDPGLAAGRLARPAHGRRAGPPTAPLQGTR